MAIFLFTVHNSGGSHVRIMQWFVHVDWRLAVILHTEICCFFLASPEVTLFMEVGEDHTVNKGVLSFSHDFACVFLVFLFPICGLF